MFPLFVVNIKFCCDATKKILTFLTTFFDHSTDQPHSKKVTFLTTDQPKENKFSAAGDQKLGLWF